MGLIRNDNGSGFENRGTYRNINTATTTVLKSARGFLHRIIINSAAANGVITVYDNTSAAGTKVATITQPASVLQSQNVLEYGCYLTTGLTIVTSSTDDITVVFD